MKQYRLHVEVEHLDDGEFYAHCPELQGCRALGDTLSEALENVEDAAKVLIELCLEKGLPLPPELAGATSPFVLEADVVVSVGA